MLLNIFIGLSIFILTVITMLYIWSFIFNFSILLSDVKKGFSFKWNEFPKRQLIISLIGIIILLLFFVKLWYN